MYLYIYICVCAMITSNFECINNDLALPVKLGTKTKEKYDYQPGYISSILLKRWPKSVDISSATHSIHSAALVAVLKMFGVVVVVVFCTLAHRHQGDP